MNDLSAASSKFSWRSFVAVLIVIAGIVYGHLSLPRLQHSYYKEELTFDVTSYYLYLPMTFIYQDPGMKNRATTDSIFSKYKPSPTFYQAFDLENGNKVLNYTCGFAYAYAPFFFIANMQAEKMNFPKDGFSFPYQFWIGRGVFIYILLGWFFLRKVLLRYMPDTIAAAALLITAFGTNYYSEAINNYLQPHAMLFSAYSVLLYCVYKWHDGPKKRYLIAGGLVMGWMILSRPSEIVCLLIPLLWNVYDKQSLNAKIQLIKKYRSHVWLLILCGILVFIPQFYYWYKVTGSPLFFSYQRTEGFDFTKPHILNVLFSFKKSLLVYTPVLIFTIIGLFRLRKYNKEIQPAVVMYAAVNFYLLASWAAWWNGGSFGMRYFSESYAVMALPLGFILQDISTRKFFLKGVTLISICFFVFLNLFQTWQFLNWLIPDDRMTYAYYKKVFLKTKVSDEDRKLMEIQRSIEATERFTNDSDYTHYQWTYFNFDQPNMSGLVENKLDTTFHHSGIRSFRVDSAHRFSPKYKIPYFKLVKENKDHVWLRVSLYFYSAGDIQKDPASLIITMPHKKYNLKYKGFDFEKYPHVNGQWNKITAEYMTPFPYNDRDFFEFYIWYRGTEAPVYIDDFRIEVFDPK
ncbi:MAG: glycosyltransferase family 39 protein [Bacteroidia bacterium]